jgi:CelD/BcsL family acetyltransferase involved in cellulose biosynthesis
VREVGYNIIQESFINLISYWDDSKSVLKWNSPFMLPTWMEIWWHNFADNAELNLSTGRKENEIIGIAPLQIKGETTSFIGSPDVCDYLDFIIVSGAEKDFFILLLDNLRQRGISHLNLGPLRPDSTVMTVLVGIAQERGYEVLCKEEGISVEMGLPATWEEYLAMLSRKQRHEVRRKLRRLWEMGDVEHICLKVNKKQVGDWMDTFFKLFSLSPGKKSRFMTARMESFFRSLADSMAEIGLLKFGILKINTLPVAMTLGFDYNESHYLYNSAYNPDYKFVSVGLLCKILCLKRSIEERKKKWDFLQGGEPYKYRIGGREIPLYRCQITIK